MKKTLTSLFLATTLILTACDADETDNSTAEEASDLEENSYPTEGTGNSEDTSDDNDQDQAESDDDSRSEDTEEHTYLYEVNEQDIATIQVVEGEEANDRVALLTYDDAPDNYAVDIAEVLKEHNAPAIFFVNGMFIESESGQDMLTEIHEMGFAIGNHTHTHQSLPALSEEEQTEEIMKTSDLIEEIIGERPRFFRAPFGQNTDHARKVVKEDGMVLMNWTYGYDWESGYMEADALADIMVNTELLRPGANLLMHDRSWTLEATPAIIEGLRDKDYELVDPDLIRSIPAENNESEETE
ncbi:polysaccharide deacetylase [Alkalibacterium sp. AK22]|uniref:polysaccharide deacetylase family protein n=1 Tax=Alkalibacterium sp. AK22 TaxID=1229520 RepID=UPI00044E6A3A|nr:polysaccharide deacetylase family protein [Alkalibacterium sp. AK22]EXJ22484.1 polysaccharide deacetylase [Alkalibacterium sp. AK22]